MRHTGADWTLPPTDHNLSFATPRRISFTRQNLVIKMYVEGKYIYSLNYADYVSTLSDLYVNGSADFAGNTDFLLLPSDTRIWGVLLWNSVRSDTEILNNHLTNMSHHWPLTSNLQDSIATNAISLSQAGAPAVFATI
jgi:hypothetical protein